MADLYYAVIALKNSEVDRVVEKLTQQKLSSIGEWLAKGKLSYGTRNEDWQPFNGRSIETLVNGGGYQSKTNLIDSLDDELSDLSGVRTIQVYFIDALALFLDKYSMLASRMDLLVAGGIPCCLVISQGLSSEQQEQLIGNYCRSLREVCREYRGGGPHRMVAREVDLENFRNARLRIHDPNSPSQAANQDERLKSGTTRPPSL